MSDDLGNPEVDFVWGNMPMQPNDQRGWGLMPGCGSAEAVFGGHLPASEAYMGAPADAIGFVKPSVALQSGDSHNIALNSWSAYPGATPGAGNLYSGQSDYVGMPNVYGMGREEALDSLRSVGFPEQYLRDFTFEGVYDTGNDPDYNGVVFYSYYAPDHIIGYHWDDSPWFAHEAEGQVYWMSSNPGDRYRTNSLAGALGNLYRFSFTIIQTTDSGKDTWDW